MQNCNSARLLQRCMLDDEMPRVYMGAAAHPMLSRDPWMQYITIGSACLSGLCLVPNYRAGYGACLQRRTRQHVIFVCIAGYALLAMYSTILHVHLRRQKQRSIWLGSRPPLSSWLDSTAIKAAHLTATCPVTRCAVASEAPFSGYTRSDVEASASPRRPQTRS